MHLNIFIIIFAVCVQHGLSLPTKTFINAGFALDEWAPVHTYDRGEDLSVLIAGSGDIDDHGSGDPDDDDGSGDVMPVPVGGFSQMRVINYSADNKETVPFFEAAVTEVLSEYLKYSEDSTEQVTVQVNSIRLTGDDAIFDFSVEVGDELWTRVMTDAILYDKQNQFKDVFGNTMIMIPHVSAPSSDKINKMVLTGVSKLTNEEKLREIIAEALNVVQETVLFSPKVPYHADNIIITDVSDDDSKLTVQYFVVYANGDVTPAADVHKAVQGQESRIAEATGASDVSIIEPSGSAADPLLTWMIAAIVVGGLVGVAFVAVVTSILVKKHKRFSYREGYEDLDKTKTQENSDRY